MRFRPTHRTFQAALGWLVLGLVVSFWPTLLALWIAWGLMMLAGLVVDGLNLRAVRLHIERSHPETMSLGSWEKIKVRLQNNGARKVAGQVFDHHPTVHEVRDLPADVEATAQGWTQFTYRLRPTQRGTFACPLVEVRLQGPMGLLQRTIRSETHTEFRVLPNFRQVANFAAMALEDRIGALGIHVQRRRGEGLEFHQLREYRSGDVLRQIDWKATSRRTQLISREYTIEQNQRVVFLLDCGRRMRSMDGEIAHFDHALNAVLLLTYVALRQGDAAGLMTFAGEDRWLAPVRGRQGLQSMMNHVFDLQPSNSPADYAQAVEKLWVRWRRRALVVVVTNLRDDDTHDLSQAISLLRRKHLVLVASLRETAFDNRLTVPVESFDDALTVAGVHHVLADRERALHRVRGSGVLVLDVTPAQLPTALVTKYLDLKRAGAL